MASTGQREHHPAMMLYILTVLFLVLVILLGFIAVFVPWVQKDIGIGVRAYAYPFKTCLVQTFSTVNEQTCLDNDFIVGPKGAPVSQGNPQCEGFILSTIAFVFISVIGGVFLLILLGAVILLLWSRPLCLAIVAQGCLILIFIACILAWVMFICFAENTCQPSSIFPVQGYSYGFICYIFATVCSLASVVTGFLALKKLKRYQPLPQEDKGMEVEDQGAFDGSYPEYAPQSMLTAPTPVVSPFAPAPMAPYSYTQAPVTQYPAAAIPQPQLPLY